MINGKYVNALELMNVPGNMIVSRNFSGNEKRNGAGMITNSFGNRNFVIKFPYEQAKALEAQGWDIFWYSLREGEEETDREAGLTVPVNLSTVTRNGTPRNPDEVIVVTDKLKTRQTEKIIGNLDTATILSATIRLIPRQKNKKDGSIKIAPYLNKMFVEIATDTFGSQYDGIPWADDEM